MNLEKEMLRRSAGLPINESSSASRIKTVDFEADLLQSFSSFFNSLERMKERMKGGYSGYGPGPYGAIRKESEKPDCQKLKIMAKEKLTLANNLVDEIFGKDDDDEEYDED